MRTLAWLQCSALMLVLAACGGDDLSPASGVAGTGGVGGEPGAGGLGGGGGPGGAGQGGSPAGGTGGLGGSGDAGVSGTSGQGGAAGSTPGGDCDHVYVSPLGDDEADGCQGSPRKTIKAGLELVSTSRSEVRICAGTYEETLGIDTSATLVGGFDCTTWASALPAPEAFDLSTAGSTLATRLVNTSKNLVGNSDPRARTVVVKENHEVTLRGLKITGHSLDLATSWAVSAAAPGSKLLVDRCVLDAGSGQSKLTGGSGSIGLEVGAKTSVTVSHSVILGGSGKGDSTGSVALGVNDGTGGSQYPVTVDHSLLDGGSGEAAGNQQKGAQGSGGLASLSPVTVTSSVVRGGSGSVNYGLSSVAMLVVNLGSNLFPIEVSDSEFDAGKGITRQKQGATAFAYSCGLLGVHIKGQVSRSRLYGGDPHAEASVGSTGVVAPSAEAMHVGGGSDLTLTNNLLVGGNQVKPALNGSGSARALVVDGQAQVTLLHNTLLGGSSTAKDTNPVALYVATGSRVQRFENNLLGVSSVPGTVGNSYNIFVEGCPDGRFATFVGNAFLPAIEPLVSYFNGNIACASTKNSQGAFFTFAEMQGVGLSTTPLAGNALVSGSCDGSKEKAACVVVPGCASGQSSACLTTILGADIGLTEIDQPFKPLTGTLPCPFTQLDTALVDVKQDALAAERMNKTTPGAIQAATCQ